MFFILHQKFTSDGDLIFLSVSSGFISHSNLLKIFLIVQKL